MLITKIEAKEACDWLKAAGFPQYVQLYRDCRFPVDTDWVRRDHDFLDKDALDSLCRRLSTLNQCVEMRVELGRSKRRVQEHEDEEACCISPRWRYDTRTRHWTRLESEGGNATPSCLDFLPADSAPGSPAGRREPAPSSCDACSLHSTSSTDSEGHRTLQRVPRQTHRGPNTSSSSSRSFGTSADDQELFRSSPGNEAPSLGEEPPSPPVSSSQSSEAERCFPDIKPPIRRNKGPSLLRRMERLRLRGTSGTLYPGRGPPGADRGLGGTTGLVISGPVLPEETEERLRRVLQGRPDSQASSTSSTSSPHAADSSSSNASSTSPSASSSAVSTPSPVTRVRRSGKRTGVGTAPNGPEDKGLALHRHTLADHRPQVSNNNKNNNSGGGHDRLLFHVPRGHKPGTFPASLSRQTPLPLPPLHPGVVTSRTLPGIDHSSSSVNWRTGSFHGYRGRQQQPPHADASGDTDDDDDDDVGRAGVAAEEEADHRASIYDNVPDDQRPSCPFVAPGDGKEPGGDGEEPGGDGEEPGGEHRVGAGLLDDGDLFSALDSVMERISFLVASWSRDLSDESPSSSSSPSSSPSSRASPAQQCSSTPSHIHLEVQRPEVEEEEEGTAPSHIHLEVQRPEVGEEEGTTTAPSPPLPPERSERGVPLGSGIEGLSVSQMHLLQKLSLLKLTSLMDKYSPCSKQGWNWTVPKSPRKVKGSEVKGRRVFGVPLLLSAQRTGDPLPPSILRALLYLRNHCLDQVGLFRKSGVKSRIQGLRDAVEADPEGVRLEGQSPFDVADMVKQYFRDLPEPLVSSRLRESFLHIYQYFPKDQQLAACQAAILLLPDEHREALRTLLLFLADVAACVQHNQMTPTNLAVCLAPSLFHLSMLSSQDHHHHHHHHAQPRSSHRKYRLGRPDQRDLSETLAATQGLAHMVAQATTLFQVPEFWGGQSALVPSEESLLLLGEGGDGGVEVEVEEEEQAMKERRCQLERNTQLLLKEAAEKNRAWETIHAAAGNHVELSSKQVDDGCPLPLWRCSVEVEAPQEEVLQRLLREPERWEEEAGGGPCAGPPCYGPWPGAAPRCTAACCSTREAWGARWPRGPHGTTCCSGRGSRTRVPVPSTCPARPHSSQRCQQRVSGCRCPAASTCWRLWETRGPGSPTWTALTPGAGLRSGTAQSEDTSWLPGCSPLETHSDPSTERAPYESPPVYTQALNQREATWPAAASVPARRWDSTR